MRQWKFLFKKSKQSSVLQIVAVNMWPYCPGPLLSVYGFHMSAQQAKPHISLGGYPQRGEAGEIGRASCRERV